MNLLHSCASLRTLTATWGGVRGGAGPLGSEISAGVTSASVSSRRTRLCFSAPSPFSVCRLPCPRRGGGGSRCRKAGGQQGASPSCSLHAPACLGVTLPGCRVLASYLCCNIRPPRGPHTHPHAPGGSLVAGCFLSQGLHCTARCGLQCV